MPLHDFICNTCDITTEEIHKDGEELHCDNCQTILVIVAIGKIADYTGVNSMAVQYATGDKTDSYLTKAPSDYTFLSKTPVNQVVV
jgi:hypothetical protein